MSHLILQLAASVFMIWGSLTTIRQTNLGQLLKAGLVVHIGYIITAASVPSEGISTVKWQITAFYGIATLIMHAGIFTAGSVICRASGRRGLSALSGLYYRAPMTAAAVLILLVSLCGLPVSIGFIGKWMILANAAQYNQYATGALVLISTFFSYFYYFRLARQMFMRTFDGREEVRMAVLPVIVIWLSALLALVGGIMPTPLLNLLVTHFP
ncbi:proton-conducting transporter membrane subunit [Paenibacillus sp. GCM10012307]|uniref:NADH:quinone oxidoreductase/Mrp antiporter transmembrane domain-containing protein n=1 Tax=Paenibacillus roseus TaxID=2798579 RepID=A0A934J5F6_9BACL|nr:proton-conducting transporter membrane subunit [Paenibacillus roseus]MBJ6361893.1 hypothetical protein [Paenibacillus roseus]